ncbi:MAG: U32 family peptidase [Eubacteriales bacterium]
MTPLKPEILSPAGDLEKLKFAVNYGADAVYLALKKFGMRTFAGNFSLEEYKSGISYAHGKNAKVYLTLNTLPRQSLFEDFNSLLASLAETPPDAFIVSDPGALTAVKSAFPDIDIHLSTQASVVNAEGAAFWHKNGVKRIVLARELSLKEIKSIREKLPETLELEAFVHGSMCVAYSGRCLLSYYFTGRNANEGSCAQPCRWKYQVTEQSREGLPVESHPDGSYVFSSRDICMIEHIGDLVGSGISAFKIEGRMRSAYYAACVTNAYKMALEDFLAGKPFDESYKDEVMSVSHREYHTGFYYDDPSEFANTTKLAGYINEKTFFAFVKSFDKETSLARCVQKNKLCANTFVKLLTPGEIPKKLFIGAIYDLDLNPIPSTPHPGMEFYLKINAKSGDIIRGN